MPASTKNATSYSHPLFLSFSLFLYSSKQPTKATMSKEFHGRKSKFTEVWTAIRIVVSCSGFAYLCGKSLSFLQNLRQFGHHENTTMNK